MISPLYDPEEHSLTMASLSALEVCWIRAPPKRQTVEQIKADVSRLASHCWAGGKGVVLVLLEVVHPT